MTNSAMIKAADREHSIKLTTYFYTDGIASDVKGEVIPKHCWDQGVIAVKGEQVASNRRRARRQDRI